MPRQSELLNDLTQFIGYQPAIILVRGWGGRRLRVPANVDERHPIALAIGLEPAERLAAFYGGTELELPAERNALLEMRNRQIVSECETESTRAVARRYGLTARHVRYIKAQAEAQHAAE